MSKIRHELIKAALQFKAKYNKALCKKRGFKDWREALMLAWYQGWDDREPNGGLLRMFRNNGGHDWLKEQKP